METNIYILMCANIYAHIYIYTHWKNILKNINEIFLSLKIMSDF